MNCLYLYKWLFGAEMFSGLSRNAPQTTLALPSSDCEDTHKTKLHQRFDSVRNATTFSRRIMGGVGEGLPYTEGGLLVTLKAS